MNSARQPSPRRCRRCRPSRLLLRLDRWRSRVVVAVGATLLALLALVSLAGPAGATWSVVATDPATGEVGAAIASCVSGDVLGNPDETLVPVVLVPGRVAAVTQAQFNAQAVDRIEELVAAGARPDQIVADLISSEFDDDAQLRQHAVVSLDGDVAAFTGTENAAEALDRQGSNVSVQGNLLVSSTVVSDALDAYDAAAVSGRSMAEALTDALLAGSSAGGDRRCGEQTALFAQVVVAGPGDSAATPSTLLTVLVDEGDGQNPVEILAASMAAGQRGVIDVGQGPSGSAGAARLVVLVIAVAALGVATFVFRRGLGSTAARRSS